ncbi:MAG: PAS domain S-box protein [Bacteroidales bacterium]|nr:PAS domain S-box protein [Bacteroidales bacterium]
MALKESNEKFSKAFQSSPYSITISRLEDGGYIEVNDTFVSMSGFTRKEALSNTTIGLNIWVDKEERNSVISTLLSGKDVEGKEFQFSKKNGEIMTGLFSAKIINVNKEPYMIASVDDITERKKGEEHLKESHQIVEGIINSIPARVFWKDKNLVYLGCNTLFANDAGFSSPKDIIGNDDFQMGWSKVAKLYRNDDLQVIISKKPKLDFEESQITPEGNTINLLTSKTPLLNKQGEVTGILGTYVDITERKNAERALAESRKITERYLNLAADLIMSLDTLGNITLLNDSGCKLLGYKTDELIGKNWFKTCISQEISSEILNDFEKLINGNIKTYENFENSVKTKSGELKTILWHNTLLKDLNGKITGTISSGVDITERKQAELELSIAKEKAEESDRLKSAFLTNMSHEIRTPMNGILGFAELLKEPNLSSDDLKDYIQTIEISGARMLNTINSIVDMSKIESGLMGIAITEANINEQIEFTYKFFKPEVQLKGLKFSFKTGLPTKESIIKTDNEKVYGILTNLVRNAIKFTFEGSIEFGYEKKGQYLEFFVKDTGVGIPQKQHQMIFERFRQGSESHSRGYEGNGLGLSICKSYVEMLGGRIWVESEEGLGSTFYFSIPYNAVSKEKTEIIHAEFDEYNEVEIKNLKILIVEDDKISYSLLFLTLQKISKEVIQAITGVEAVEACRNNPDFDLVLMDIRMPQMNGLEATRQIRQFNKEVIIIAQTAYAFVGDREKAIEAGCNDYISKPINKTLLYELIKKHCKKWDTKASESMV